MASLSQCRLALAQTIDANTSSELYIYDQVADVGHLPAVLIEPTAADFQGAIARGLDVWMFNVFILVNRNDMNQSQAVLDSIITGDGPDSIRAALFANPFIGLEDGTQADVIGMKGYGGSFEWAAIPHIGAILQVRVLTSL